MSTNQRFVYKLSIAAAVFWVMMISALLLSGQTASPRPLGVPDDWTHHHVVFSDPGSAADALAKGQVEHWYRVVNDPRYKIQQWKRKHPTPPPVTPPPPSENSPLERDWSMNMGGVAASQTGTFTTSSGTGTVVVDGVTLTASPGTAASQTTTISANGVASGNTITITNPMVGSPLVLTASTPLAQEDQIAFGAEPSTGGYITIQGIEYEFETSGWTSGSEATTTCYIARSTTTSNMVAWLASAITTGKANTGASTSTWQCGTAASQPSNGATVTSSTSPNVDITAKIPGATGFGTPTLGGTSNLTVSVLTAGSNGSSTTPNFQWWSGAAAASTTALATNIATAIGAANAVGVGATNPVAGEVKITAALSGLAGNSISVATTISSGLTGSAFNGDLSGAAAGTTSGATFSTSTDNTTEGTDLANEAAALASAIITNVSALTATSSGAVVTAEDKTVGTGGNTIALSSALPGFTWAGADLSGGTGSTAATVGAGTFPAKYSFSSTTANCDNATPPDYVIYNTGLAGSATEPSIVAYDNLYSGCSTASVPVPNVYWQYNTGGTITTSPVLSYDGTQVAFVQLSGGAAQLVMLKWSKGSAIQTLTSQATAAAYTTCTAPCMFAITFAATIKFKGGTGGATTATTPTDTYSSPFYDYYSDTIYVGEDNGYTHKFTPVFLGAPAEVTTNWPVQTAVAPINSPVYDANSGLVFDGPAVYESNSSAYFHSIPSTGTTATATKESLCETGTDGVPIFVDAAILDPSVPALYVFVNDDDGTDITGTAPPATSHAAVWQLPETFPLSALPPEAKVGQAAYAAGDPIYAGQFDNIYETASGPVGNLYVCGRDANSQEPALWRIPINTTMGTPVEIGALTTAATNCSPITEFYNTSTSTDYLFLSVEASSTLGTCGGAGCIMSFTVTTALCPTGTGCTATPTATLTESGGTSGITVDNAVGSTTLAGASQVYFSPLGSQACIGNGTTGSGTGGCAIQASQAGLQ
jgi:hypothetical protein